MYNNSDRWQFRVRAALATALALALLALGGGGSAEAATYNVNTFADELTNNGNCSLREAIRASNLNAAVDACPAGGATTDIITLQPGTYTLSLAGPGEDSAATGDLDITTPTPSVGNLVSIVGNGATVDGGAIDRVFDMYDALPKASTLTMSNLTVRNGNPGANNGGGIRVGNGDALNLTNVVVAENTTGLAGGGISSAGTVNLTDVTIRDNSASGAGGGFQNAAATSSLTASRSTISGNVAMGTGGAGFYNESSATANMTNVTISGNTATNGVSSGGGIHNRTGATVTLTNVTVTGNGTGSFGGGGIKNNGTGAVNVKSTIVAGNTSSLGPDCNGTMTSQGHNLVQNTSGCTITGDSTGNITGQDPLLGALANNGGPTLTHALPANSPATNATDNSGCPAADQRGVARPQFTTCDIGAYEYDGASPPPTPTPSPPPTPSPSPTPAATATPTPTATPPGQTPSPTPTPTPPGQTPSPTPTATPTPTPVGQTPSPTPAGQTPTPTPTVTPTPGPTGAGQPLTQGDVDCNGSVTSVDALKELRYAAQLGITQTEPCPDIGEDMGWDWGDVDCSGATTSVDALKILRHVSGLSVAQAEPCADIGTPEDS